MRLNQSSVRIALVRIVPVFLLMLTFMAPAIGSAQTVTPSSVMQAPALPGVPKEIEVIAFGTLTLPAGDYRWQTTRLPAFANAGSLIAVHRGFLIAVNNPVAILKADGTVREVATGAALPLAEGEQFAAVQVNGVPADMMIVEFPLVSDVDPKETPASVTAVPLKQGAYTFAVLAIPAHKPGDPTPGQMLAKAAGPGIAVYPFAVGQSAATPATGANAGPYWLVAIFPASSAASQPGSGPGSGSGGGNQSGTGTGSGQGQGTGNGNGSGGGSGSNGSAVSTTSAPTATTAVTPSPTSSSTSIPSPTSAPTIAATATTAPAPTAATGSGSGSGSAVIKDPKRTTNYSDLVDSDGDGLTNGDERLANTNPNVKDTDGDGLWDGPEVENGCHPLETDTDGDGITDEGEILLYKTSCRYVDTDTDGLSDYAEIFGASTSNPLLADTDGDALSDFDEVTIYHSDPRYVDSDGDGWTDTYEALTTGTNPALVDGDFDCLSDPLEATLGTNPGLLDSDGDLLGDGQEHSDGTNPLDSNDFRHLDEPQNPIPACDGTFSLN